MKNFKVFSLIAVLFCLFVALSFVACNKSEVCPIGQKETVNFTEWSVFPPVVLPPGALDFTTMTLNEVKAKTKIKIPGVVEELDYMLRHELLPKDKFNDRFNYFHNTGIIEFGKVEGPEDWMYPLPIQGDYGGYSRTHIQNLIKDEKAGLQSGMIENGKHRRFANMYSGGTITVHPHANLPTAWKTAAYNACAAWNALGYNVQFNALCLNNSSFMANVLDIDYGPPVAWMGSITNAVAAVTRPSAGANLASENITVLTSYSGPAISASLKKSIMMHEIGHAIGLAHTDTNSGLQVPVVPCAQSSQTNPSSIMQPTGSISTFSSCDLQVINYYW